MTYSFIRHGQTDWNSQGRVQGVSDVPLNEVGRGQARDAAVALSTASWDSVVSSPLGRARETAQIIADRLGLELGPAMDEFAELDWGAAEGMFDEEVTAQWPDWQPPGKEPDERVGARGLRGLERVRAEYGDRNVIIAAHGTLIRYTLASITDVWFEAYPNLENGAASHVHFDADATAWNVLTVGGVAADEVALLEGPE
ncbi:histidine phosphatase family protein [soil metagenome]